MNIKTAFDFEEIVYLLTDIEQLPRMVTSFSIFPPGVIVYRLSCGENETSHYEMEISSDKNYIP
jgi:hypothetical protein